MKKLIIIWVLFLSSSLLAVEISQNPFDSVTAHTLKNGMKVFLAPNQSSKNINISLRVMSGGIAEDKKSLEANHVLEHMLFKDGRIEGNKSYLEVITEAGGEVNAYVSSEHTAYYGEITAEKGEWLIGLFKQMIFFRDLDETEFLLALNSVEIEIGKPFFLSRWLGFDPLDTFFNFYFPGSSYAEREFGLAPSPFSFTDERIALRKLELDTVKSIYNDYYYPSNMIFFISGKFDPDVMLSFLENTFSDVKERSGKTVKPKLATKMGETYHRIYPIYEGDYADISYGLKLYNKTPEEVFVIGSYLNYVAHRLMIEFRNKKGETYTAFADIEYSNKYGEAHVNFKTPLDKYESNRSYLVNLIKSETIEGKFDNASIKEAMDLYMKGLTEKLENDSGSMMELAQLKHFFMTEYGDERDPYTIVKSITDEDYKRILTEQFSSNKSHIVEFVPPALFKYDYYVLTALTILASVLIFKSALQNHDEIRNTLWVTKITTTPGKIVEVASLAASTIVISYLVLIPFISIFEYNLFYKTNIYLSTYLDRVLSVALMVGAFMWQLSRFPTRLIFTGNQFVIKSLVLREMTLNLDEVVMARTVGPFKKYSLGHLFKSKFSLSAALFNWAFWRSAIEIKTTSGTSYILNVKGAEELAGKINGVLDSQKDSFLSLDEAA